MTEKKRKIAYWVLKVAGIIISCALPIWAILAKFPLWVENHGTGRSVGAGVVLSAIVLLIVFRRTVFDFLRDKCNLKHAPPITIWIVLIITSYSLVYISDVLFDMNIIFWMGFIGCAIGSLLTYIAEHKFGKKVEDNERA